MSIFTTLPVSLRLSSIVVAALSWLAAFLVRLAKAYAIADFR
jgi:hypothetical protein